MTQPNDEELRNHMLTMLSVASGMTGVCATAVGLVGVVKHLKSVDMIVDDLFSMGAIVFMLVTVLSFVGLRHQGARRSRGLMLSIDLAFLVGLVMVVGAAGLLTWKAI
jgi:uncharacterized protein involved in response to NO